MSVLFDVAYANPPRNFEFACVRPFLAGQHPQKSGFADPIGPNQRETVVSAYFETGPIEDGLVAIGLGQVLCR
jgi:hypothetical protein